MVHLKPLPGSPRGGGSFEDVYRQALRDGTTLAEGGMDALLVENFGDAPFLPGSVEPHTVAALALAARMLRDATGLPVGVNCLRNDGPGALGAAAAAGAGFIRVNVYTGASVTDQGLIQGCAAELLRYRRILGARVKVAADLLVKHAVRLGETDPGRLARETMGRGLADVLVLTGPETGTEVDLGLLRVVRASLPQVPVLIGSGVREDNLEAYFGQVNGLIVGTSLKEEGKVERPVCLERVKALVARAQGLG